MGLLRYNFKKGVGSGINWEKDEGKSSSLTEIFQERKLENCTVNKR